MALASADAGAATYYVDRANAGGCSDSPIWSNTPYCTISGALAVHRGPGVTIQVRPGVYYESIDIPASGEPGNPFVLRGGPGVVIDATNQLIGINVEDRSWVTIEGFTVLGTGDGYAHALEGIMVKHAAHVAILDNTVKDMSHWGIGAADVTDLLLARNTITNNPGHGIQLRGVTHSVIEDNLSYFNTNGINFVDYDTESRDNLIQRNRFLGNTGSGIYAQKGSTANLFVQNVLWGNEHGIQHNGSTDCRHLGDVVYGNFDDGITLKDGSRGHVFVNCIAANNGLGRTAYDFYIENDSMEGLISEDNLIWNSQQDPIKYGDHVFAAVTTFSAQTGLDTRTIQADPLFLDPDHGDFRLIQGSPAIDAGNSSVEGWPTLDAQGSARIDDAGTPNTGRGPIDYADRGAYEFAPAGLPPVASLEHRPAAGGPEHTFVIDASGSHDPEDALLWYRFDFGDGTTVGPQAQPTARHTFGLGTWVVTVTVADASGWTDSDVETLTVVQTAPPAPARTALLAPAPNPMRGLARFAYTVAAGSDVRLTVVDVQGRTIAVLTDRFHEPGAYEASWDGRAAGGTAEPGLYFVRMESPGGNAARRFVLGQ